LLLYNKDKELIEEKAGEFNKYIELFSRLYSADEGFDDEEIRKQEQELVKEIQNDTSALKDSLKATTVNKEDSTP